MKTQTDVPDYVTLVCGHFHDNGSWWTFRNHGSNDWFVAITLAGSGTVRSDTCAWEIGSHSLLLIKPGVPHRYGPTVAGQAWERIWVHFHPRSEWQDLLYWSSDSDSPMRLHIEDAVLWKEIAVCAQLILRYAGGSQPRHDAYAMNQLERLLLLADEARAPEVTPFDSRILNVVSYIDQHLGQELTNERICQVACLSRSRLLHLFRKELGMPLARYISTRRLKRAQDLLVRTSLTMSQVADALALDPTHFARWFRTETGVSPGVYRKMHQQKHSLAAS